MFGIDDAVLIIAASTTANILMELGVEIVAEWLMAADGNAWDPVVVVTHSLIDCSEAAEAVFFDLASSTESDVSCVGSDWLVVAAE